MYKHLLSLVLVLALISTVSANTASWNTNVAVGAWEDSSNWTTTSGATLPPGMGAVTTDFAAPYPGSGLAANTVTLSSTASVGRLKYQFQTSTLNINSGGYLLNNGSVGGAQLYTAGAAATINVNNGGALIVKGSTYGMDTGAGAWTINVNSGGLLGVYGTSGHLASQALWLGGTSSGGGATTVNVYGTIDADSITMVNTNHVVKLYLGGVIYSYNAVSGIQSGDSRTVLSTTMADPTSGPLSGLTVTKYYEIPEPATIALLGLGGLLLRRKK